MSVFIDLFELRPGSVISPRALHLAADGASLTVHISNDEAVALEQIDALITALHDLRHRVTDTEQVPT